MDCIGMRRRWGGVSRQPVVSYNVQVTPDDPPSSNHARLQRFFVLPLDAPTEARVTGLQNGFGYRFTVSAEVFAPACGWARVSGLKG